MIYASRIAESLNRTYNSEPVTLHNHDWADGFCQHPDCDTFVPTHEANPILVEFREDTEGTAWNWLANFNGRTFSANPAHIDHAKKVLTHLAAFTKED